MAEPASSRPVPPAQLENIFINRTSGEIKIGDLGLAKTVTGVQKLARTCVGTHARQCAPSCASLTRRPRNARVHGARVV
jgi:serine/threonine protein kinase